MNGSLTASVVITTKDRCDDLRRALASCVIQSCSCELIVVDDGSSDGTAEMVAEEFPTVRLVRHSRATGYIVGRNEAARLAVGDVIFSIDDDAVFTTPHVVVQTLAEFDDPRVGAVAIPYIDVRKDSVIRQLSPDQEGIYITDRYIGTAHAVRREVFLTLGGYRESYFHQGEEGDFCARLYDAGYVVRLGNADVIHHYESPKRDTRRMDIYGRRNDLLAGWLNVPLPLLPIFLCGTVAKGLWFGFRVRRPVRMSHGVIQGFVAIWKYRRDRRPVNWRTFRLLRKLRRGGPVVIGAADAELGNSWNR